MNHWSRFRALRAHPLDHSLDSTIINIMTPGYGHITNVRLMADSVDRWPEDGPSWLRVAPCWPHFASNLAQQHYVLQYFSLKWHMLAYLVQLGAILAHLGSNIAQLSVYISPGWPNIDSRCLNIA